MCRQGRRAAGTPRRMPGTGARLRPDPVPVDIKPRVLATTIDLDDGTAALSLALSVAEYFGLDQGEAWEIAAEVGAAVATWHEEAARQGLTASEIYRVSSAFEHDDLRAARTAR